MRKQSLLLTLVSPNVPAEGARRFRPCLEQLERRIVPTTFTTTSPTSAGVLPASVSSIGGIVLDLVGFNGQRVVSQLSARSLFAGFFNRGTPVDFRGNPGTIGVQTGFTSELADALGGGLAEIAVRLTVSDGDTAAGDFDFDDNVLLLNGVPLGSFSDVPTEATTPDGQTTLSTNAAGGFRNDRLDTGFFHSTDPAFLQAFFVTLGTGAVVFQLDDVEPFDNFFDFTIGIGGDLLDNGTPPTIVNPLPPLPPVTPEVPGPPTPPAQEAPPAEVVAAVVASPNPVLAIALVQTGATKETAIPQTSAPAPSLQLAPLVRGGVGDPALPPTAANAPDIRLLTGSEEEAEPPSERTDTAPDLVGATSQAARAVVQLTTSVTEATIQTVTRFTRQAAEAVDQVFIDLQTETTRIRLATVEARVPEVPTPVETAPPAAAPELTPTPEAPTVSESSPARSVIRTTVLMLSAVLIHRNWSSSRASAAILIRLRRRANREPPPSSVADTQQGADASDSSA